MANKNINLQKVMTDYAEELASILTEKKQPEIDPLWNTWYDEAYLYEPDGKYDIPMESTGKMFTERDMQELSEAVVEMIDDMPLVQKDRRTGARRYEQTKRHNERTRRNAIDVRNSYRKRIMEDMENWSFCKKRGGRRVDDPKSLSMKSDAILKRAEKMMLIESEDAQEDTNPEKCNQNTVQIDNEQTKVA